MRFYLLIELARASATSWSITYAQIYKVLIAPNVESECEGNKYDCFPRVFLETQIWRKHSLATQLDLDWLTYKNEVR